MKGAKVIQENYASDKEIQKIEKEVPALVGKARDLKVVTEEGLVEGTKVVSAIRDRLKIVEARRKFFVGPLNDHIKRINSWFKSTFTNVLEEADGIVTDKLLEYRRKEAEKIAKKNERIVEKAEERAESKGVKFEPPPPVMQAKSVGLGTFSKRWTFEVVDLGKVPNTYMALDESKVRRAITGNALVTGVREIPGLRIYEEEVLSRR